MKFFPIDRSAEDILKKTAIETWPALAVRYIAQMMLALYPPFLVLAVVHKFYTEKQELLILKKLKALPIAPIEAQQSPIT